LEGEYHELLNYKQLRNVQGGSNMTGTYAACLHRNQSRSYLNHLVQQTTAHN